MAPNLPLTPAERAARRVGTTVLKWKLDALLGVGGTAAVFAATHHNRSRVALKILHRELAASAELRTRFLREAYVANSVGHEGAVQVLDDQLSEEGEPVLIMQLLEGKSLDSIQAARGVLPIDEALGYADQILDVLIAAHTRGIVHRDIKPQNVFITAQGTAKVLDFGVARLFDGNVSLTATGSLVGTPAFMPPEQAGGRTAEIGPASDLWSLGATVFNLLTGRFVHESQNVQQHTVKAAVQPARSIATLRPDLPAPLVEWVDKALAFDIPRRFQSAREMRDALASMRAAIAPRAPRFSDPGLSAPAVPPPRFSDPGLAAPAVPPPRFSDPGPVPSGAPPPQPVAPQQLVAPQQPPAPAAIQAQAAFYPVGPQGGFAPPVAAQQEPAGAPAQEPRDPASIARLHGLPPPAPKKQLTMGEKAGIGGVAVALMVVIGLVVRALSHREPGPQPSASSKPTGSSLSVWLGSSGAPRADDPASPSSTGSPPGGFVAEEGRAALEAAETEAKKCSKRPGPKGRVSVQVTFYSDGTTAAQVEIAFNKTPVGLCVEEAFREKAKVKPFEGSAVTVTKMVFVE